MVWNGAYVPWEVQSSQTRNSDGRTDRRLALRKDIYQIGDWHIFLSRRGRPWFVIALLVWPSALYGLLFTAPLDRLNSELDSPTVWSPIAFYEDRTFPRSELLELPYALLVPADDRHDSKGPDTPKPADSPIQQREVAILIEQFDWRSRLRRILGRARDRFPGSTSSNVGRKSTNKHGRT